MNKPATLTLILLAATVGAVAAYLAATYNIPTTGTIKTVGLKLTWTDNTPVTSITWPDVDPDTPTTLKTPLINITNIENTPCKLTLSATDTSPTITSLTLTWNYTDTTLPPGDWLLIELTQTITATGPYTYTTTITATEAP